MIGGRIVDITSDGVHLSVTRGFMKISKDHEQIGQVALDDIAALIIHAHGATFSANLVIRLAERGTPMVMCAANHNPIAFVLPLHGHFEQGKRMRAQADASKRKRDRIWRDLIKAKIVAQGDVLDACGMNGETVRHMHRTVKAGDPDNVEAQAARRYWPLLFGKTFRRDRNMGDINAHLNYGYTVLRAAAARSILGAGLHPSLSVHHISGGEALRLADDVMEPFRPFVDMVVFRLAPKNEQELSSDSKRELAAVTEFDLSGPKGASPIRVCLDRLCVSMAQMFTGEVSHLELPGSPLPLLAARQ
ncbi:CRISPR-associated protein Cas1 [hydrothermal vent metagenome]|uniref:CRISPR-associated protein Cas1 n=1 Tax=hydrothermal vent metagenome TaxID=652676 RepID=A0A3B0SAI0_9ZZZZ